MLMNKLTGQRPWQPLWEAENDDKGGAAEATPDTPDHAAEIAKLKADLAKANASAQGAQRLKTKTEEELQEAKAKLEKVGHLADLDEAALAKVEKLQADLQSEADQKAYSEGGIDALVQRRVADKVASVEALAAAKAQEAEELQKKLEENEQKHRQANFSRDVMAAANSATHLLPGIGDFVVMKARDYAHYDDSGKMVLRMPGTGEDLFSVDKPGERMTIKEWVEREFPKIAPGMLKTPRGGGGSGADGTDTKSGDNPFMDRKRIAEQAKIRNENLDMAKTLAKQARAKGKGKQIAVSGV